MKTREEWMQQLACRRKHPEDCNAIITQGIIKQIQDDAWTQGMRDATEICKQVNRLYEGGWPEVIGKQIMSVCVEKILAAGEKKPS